MAVNKITGTFSNAGSPAPSGQFGPFAMTGVVKVLHAKVTIETVSVVESWTTSTTLVAGAMVGMQVVFGGGTPFDLPSGAALVNFLDHIPQSDDDSLMAWAPSSDTAAVVVKSERNLEWYGQKYFGAPLDFYVTWGSTYTSVDQQYAGYFEVVYTT